MNININILEFVELSILLYLKNKRFYSERKHYLNMVFREILAEVLILSFYLKIIIEKIIQHLNIESKYLMIIFHVEKASLN
jgi:hypothetical protein